MFSMSDAEEILQQLHALGNPANVAGMARYGINPQGTLGISIPTLRQIAKQTGKNHALAQELWSSGIHEARILAAYLGDPKQLSEAEMERWALDFDSWDVCDQVCSNLFETSPHAVQKARQWSERPETFVKRAGFVIMASLAVHQKKLPDELFREFLELIARQANDERNFVRKATNWALRQIGKRNRALNQAAIETAQRLLESPSKAARWVATDSLRELQSEKVHIKLNKGGL